MILALPRILILLETIKLSKVPVAAYMVPLTNRVNPREVVLAPMATLPELSTTKAAVVEALLLNMRTKSPLPYWVPQSRGEVVENWVLTPVIKVEVANTQV